MMFRPTSPLAMVVKRNGNKPDDVEINIEINIIKPHIVKIWVIFCYKKEKKMEKELSITKVIMSPNKFKQNEEITLSKVEILAYTDSQIILSLNAKEFITGIMHWVIPANFKMLEDNEFTYTIIKDISTKEIGDKQAKINFKKQNFLIDYEVLGE